MNAFLAALIACALMPVTGFAGTVNDDRDLIAFSMADAERAIRSGEPLEPEVPNLGGITRLMGLVFDRDAKDLILVGRGESGKRPLDLDSLVVAMRAVLTLRQWPLVSIDPMPGSEQSGKQAVRLEGGIGGSRFGLDFVLADVRLKKLGLNIETPLIMKGHSYFELRAAVVKTMSAEVTGSSRFWFYAIDPGLEQRDDVFLIRRLKLGVRAQTITGRSDKAGIVPDIAADTFAERMTGAFGELGHLYPEIDRLQGLYEMVAIARGMDAVSEAVSEFWLKDFAVSPIETPTEFDVIGSQRTLKTPAGIRSFEVSGGIQFRALTIRLLDGDMTALKEAVLLSRPKDSPIAWRVPVDGEILIGSPVGALQEGHTESDPGAGSHLEWTLREQADAAARKRELDNNVAALSAHLKDLVPKTFEPLPEPPASDGSNNDGANRQKNNGQNSQNASRGSYTTKDGGKTFTRIPAVDADNGSVGQFLCITASCVGPKQASSDGLKADPYARGNINPYALNRYFESGYTVSKDGKTVGSGYGDVKLIGGGIYAAKMYMDANYYIYDSSGKKVSSKGYGSVQSLGDTGAFAVDNEDGYGTTTIHGKDLKPIKSLPTYEVDKYVSSNDFTDRVTGETDSDDHRSVGHQPSPPADVTHRPERQNQVSGKEQIVPGRGGIKAKIDIIDDDFKQAGGKKK